MIDAKDGFGHERRRINTLAFFSQFSSLSSHARASGIVDRMCIARLGSPDL
jgi:hypothetical protein